MNSDVEMEDDNQEGPFAVWQMFNAPTMVLFSNIDNAVDGLDRLLVSILKLTGDFSEVLVPRQSSSKFPDCHYEAFNTWLLGRLFYIWSVNGLERIHGMSKEAQLKILNILCVNNATFYNSLLCEYFTIVTKLSNYYETKSLGSKDCDNSLVNFKPNSVEIPNTDLNLEPIYVTLNDLETCERILCFTLELLSETVPTNSIEMNKKRLVFCDLFETILHMFENYSLDMKLTCLKFFSNIIQNCNKACVTRFEYIFVTQFHECMCCVEAMVSILPLCHEQGEINLIYVEEFNSTLLQLFQNMEKRNIDDDILVTISSVILSSNNNKLFKKPLIMECLAWSAFIDLPQEIVNISSKSHSEIKMLKQYYVKEFSAITDGSTLTNICYKQLQSVVESIDTVHDSTDDFLMEYHVKRCCAAMNILLNIYIHRYNNVAGSNELISKDIVINSVSKILSMHKQKFARNKDILKEVLDLILTCAISTKMEIMKVLSMICLQNKLHFQPHDLNFSDEVKALILNYLLVVHIVLQRKIDEFWMKIITHLLNSVMKNKTETIVVKLIQLCPLLLESNVQNVSRLISEILLPALLTKVPEIQKLLCEILPAMACMALGNHSLMLGKDDSNNGHIIFANDGVKLSIVCTKCHKITLEKSCDANDYIVLHSNQNTQISSNSSTVSGQRSLFAKFLNLKAYQDPLDSGYYGLIQRFANHTILNSEVASEIFNKNGNLELLGTLRSITNSIMEDDEVETSVKDSILNTCITHLVDAAKRCLESNNCNKQSQVLDYIREFGLAETEKVLLPSTKLVVYFIMHPQCPLAAKAGVYLRDICEAHERTPNQVYHRYKKDYCRLFVDCSLYTGQDFALSLLKVVRAFGFVGYRDFISKDVHHFLPYLIPYSVKIKEIPVIIQEIASLVQCTVSDFLIERFPHVYTHIYLNESDLVTQRCFDLIEKLTKMSTLSLVKRHFRVILTEFLLQFCCNPEKVLNACRYLASHDPDVSTPTDSTTMTTSQVADFLQPKFLGVLAYFDHKLVNTKVALSVKRKALQSFPDIMNLMGVKYLTPLRFKVLATLRSALSLAKEFPKILANAWSGFIHNIDSMSLGSLLTNLAVSLLHQYEYAPHEINKIFQYLVISNENLLSSHLSDLFFLEDSNIAEKVKFVIRKHVRLTQPDGFLERVKWYLQHLNQDIPTIRACAFTHLDRLLKGSRSDLHKAIFGGKNIDPIIVELIDSLMSGCKDPDSSVSLAAGGCLGQLGAIEAGHLPRRYVQPDRSPFAFSINDDCFAATALVELSRAFQYEKDTTNMDCYALTIQEILKIYKISPTGEKKDVWNSFPENMHQVMYPLLSSRYTLAYPSQAKKAHPLFGSAYATTFLEWAHNWAGQLIPLIESESIRELLRTVHPSMRRDVRTLFLFLPYVLLHAVMSKNNAQYIQEEILAVIGVESFESGTQTNSRTRPRLLRHVRLTPAIAARHAEEGNQSKCSKMIYNLLDFLNRWLLEWSNSKQNPLQNENYKAISSFLSKFDKLEIARGNLMCGEFPRALQYLEMYMTEEETGNAGTRGELLPLLAEVYALLDEPDCVAGIQSMNRSEPSLKELILAQVVTGRLQDAALCYERLAQQGPLDRPTLQGMVDCYLGLDQPFTAYRLLSELEDDEGLSELAAEPLWRLSRFEELERLVQKPVPPSRENWGLLMGRIFIAYRSEDTSAFQRSCREGMARLLSQMDAEAKGENALRSGYQSVLGLHIIKEAELIQELFVKLKSNVDGSRTSSEAIGSLMSELCGRCAVVRAEPRSLQPLLTAHRTLLQQTQELLESTHPQTASKLKSCIGDLWLQSAKHARKVGIFQQSYMYILNAEEYRPEELFIEKAKMYWARGQHEQAFTTLRRGLDDAYPQVKDLSQAQRKICAKAKLLIAKYNDETTSVDVDVNIGYYKDAVNVFKQWEKSLVCLGEYYEKISSSDSDSEASCARRLHALNSYGKALQYGHKYLYQSMPRMLSIWLDYQVSPTDANSRAMLSQLTEVTKVFASRLPLLLYLTAFSQIVSRICHPEVEVYTQLKAIIVKLIIAYPQHTLWMMISVIKSSYPQRIKRCQDVFADPRLKEPKLLKLVRDFTQLAENLIELCNKPIAPKLTSTTVSSLVRTLPRLLDNANFSRIMMPFEQFCKIVLPSKAARGSSSDFHVPTEPPVYIAGIQEHISILPSLQKPRKVTLKGSDGKSYIIMLKPNDDLRRDFRLMEFNGVVNRFLQDAPETRRRRLYIRTYSVLPLNELCGLIEWVPNLVGLRLILLHIYKQKGLHTSNRELKELMCHSKDPVEKKRRIYEEQLLPRHPPVFHEWFRRVFSDPYGWYQARSAYIRTTAVMSMVGYILGLGDRHGENISFDSTNGDTVHVDFNCLFNKGESFEWPERVPFRLTHNMEAAMGPLKHEGMFRKCCEAAMRVLRAQTSALMSVVGPFVYDPLVSWGRVRTDSAERTNEQALHHLQHIRNRLNGMVRTNDKQLSLALSPEGQVEHLIAEATSVHNLCQMYIGWGPFL